MTVAIRSLVAIESADLDVRRCRSMTHVPRVDNSDYAGAPIRVNCSCTALRHTSPIVYHLTQYRDATRWYRIARHIPLPRQTQSSHRHMIPPSHSPPQARPPSRQRTVIHLNRSLISSLVHPMPSHYSDVRSSLRPSSLGWSVLNGEAESYRMTRSLLIVSFKSGLLCGADEISRRAV